MKLIHSTCIQMDGIGVLLRGPSGSGKSDLALRLVMRGARLVADDYVYVGSDNGMLYATAPDEIRGKLEVRGIGILSMPHSLVCRVAAVVDLDGGDIDRLPGPAEVSLENVSLPCFRINPFEVSSGEKLLMILRAGFKEGQSIR